jgi:hypothetical protein
MAEQRSRVLDDFAGEHNAFELLHDCVADIHFLANDAVALVLRVVGVPQLAVRPQLKLEEFVAKFARVAHTGEGGRVDRAGIQEIFSQAEGFRTLKRMKRRRSS